jgi:hypothetical protein
LADGGPEDLPRTLRREREAREREAREREEAARAATLTHDFGVSDAHLEPHPAAPVAAAVTRFDVPFVRLMLFFIKAVFAAIPALIILGVLLWFAGAALKSLYPQLVHTEILIRVPR